MAKRIGMDPNTAAYHRAVIQGQLDQLGHISGQIAATGFASLHPTPLMFVPGMLVLTAGSVALANNAATDVTAASAAARELLGRLGVQIQEQRDASSATEGYLDGLITKAQAEALYNEVLNNPDALDGMSPQQVQAWWSQLSGPQRDELVREAHWVIGNTNGVPFDVRIEANQLSARMMLEETGGMSAEQIEYLNLVDAGQINLISFDPAADRIIEMVGELGPDTQNIVNWVPGTTLSLESGASGMDAFYNMEAQQLGRELVSDAIPPGSTVVFVYKDSPWPTFNLNDGVHNSSWAASAGGPYHDFNTALGFENPWGHPVTSIEHSFGSSVGGYSESQGTQFANRIVLGGIGMTEDWTPNSGTDYYSFTGPEDIIRLARERGDVDLNMGYPEPPTSENGFQELPTGFVDLPPGTNPIVTGVVGVDQHARVGGVEGNDVVISNIENILSRT